MDKISLIIPVYTAILILVGLGYTISFNNKYSENETDDRILGVLIGVSTITALLIWCFIYLPKMFSRKTNYTQIPSGP